MLIVRIVVTKKFLQFYAMVHYRRNCPMFKQLIIKCYLVIRGDPVSALVKQGVQIGKNVFIGAEVIIDPSFPWLVSIADECTLTSRVIVLAHDASMKRHLGYTKIGRVTLGQKTFVGAGSIILPGVKIGENVIIGAGSVVAKDIPDNSVAVGNPARVIGSTADFIRHHKNKMDTRPVYHEGWTQESGITEQNKKMMYESLGTGTGYVI
jgi:maltose O-acetyltransferase